LITFDDRSEKEGKKKGAGMQKLEGRQRNLDWDPGLRGKKGLHTGTSSRQVKCPATIE